MAGLMFVLLHIGRIELDSHLVVEVLCLIYPYILIDSKNEDPIIGYSDIYLDIKFDYLLASSTINFDKSFGNAAVQHTRHTLSNAACTTLFSFCRQVIFDLIQRHGIMRRCRK